VSSYYLQQCDAAPRTQLGREQRSPRPPGWVLGRGKEWETEGERVGKKGEREKKANEKKVKGKRGEERRKGRREGREEGEKRERKEENGKGKGEILCSCDFSQGKTVKHVMFLQDDDLVRWP